MPRVCTERAGPDRSYRRDRCLAGSGYRGPNGRGNRPASLGESVDLLGKLYLNGGTHADDLLDDITIQRPAAITLHRLLIYQPCMSSISPPSCSRYHDSAGSADQRTLRGSL